MQLVFSKPHQSTSPVTATRGETLLHSSAPALCIPTSFPLMTSARSKYLQLSEGSAVAQSQVFGPERICGEKLSTFRLCSKVTKKQLKAIYFIILSSKFSAFHDVTQAKDFSFSRMLAAWRLSHPWKQTKKMENLEDWNRFRNL